MNQSPPLTSQGSLQGQYAGFVSRFIAFALDVVIILTVILLLNTTVIVILSFFNLSLERLSNIANSNNALEKTFSIFFLLLSISINFILFYGYYIIFWMLVGQTPGKMIMGVRIVSIDGGPISFFQTVRRLIGYWISMIFLFMGFFWVLISDTRQGWHDKIARTYVIYSWEAKPTYRFFKKLAHFADKRARAYENKHQPPLLEQPAELAADNNQESIAD